ncbi:MAG: glycosyl hydrolase 53 family protein [Prevotella sp.]|nr:glycosyl hydrolase 53 family protein [Prevotella sp.]
MKKLLLIMAAVVLAINVSAQKYVGGDISMLKKFVDEGAVYKDYNDQVVEPLTFFKQQGWNAQRIRLFVDPTKASADARKEGAIQDLEYVKALGKQIKDAGFKLMLDIHYSDTWTDPGNHSTPAAWSTLDATQLAQKVYEYTKDCLQQMVAAGATPDWVQVGNEITTGMLWPAGKIANGGSTWDNLANFLRNGIKACREVCPQAQVVIHTEMHNPNSVDNFYKTLATYSDIQYDIIGLSYYPDFHGALSVLHSKLFNLENAYPDKKIMIVETGYGFQWQISGATENLTATYPTTEAGQLKFTQDLIDRLDKHPNVTGIFWWYPEYNLNGIINKGGTEDWSKDFTNGYWNGALFWPTSGYPLASLKELKTYLGDDTGVDDIRVNRQDNDSWYTLDGRQLTKQPATKGLYIHSGRKVVVK